MRAFALVWLFASGAHAAETLQARVTHERGTYRVGFEIAVAAPVARVRAVMTDYERLVRLSDTVKESRVLQRAAGHTRVRQVARACVLFFCKTVARVLDVRELPDGNIEARTVPALSDFGPGGESWQFFPEADRTRIRYAATIVPTFFIPPLIGPPLLKRRIVSELETTGSRLEALARAA